MNAWPNPLGYELDPVKRPAAVVLLTRGPLVLALTRKREIANLHLPGGKSEDGDLCIGLIGDFTLTVTARRELHEEAGILAGIDQVRPLIDYVAHSGRRVRAFYVVPLEGEIWPDTFEPTDAGQPGWVPPQAVLASWCTYHEEAATILRAATAINEELALALAHVDWSRI